MPPLDPADLGRWTALATGVVLGGVSLFMLLNPRAALLALGRMGSTPLIHYGELTVRIAAGAGLAAAAAASRFPQTLLVAGLFLIVSAVVLLVLPRRWHAGYSSWWARRLPPFAVRVSGLVGAAAAGALVRAVF